MPKREEIMESKLTSSNSKIYIDPDWEALKQEYHEATRKIEEKNFTMLQKEKDDFAKMWVEAGFDLKETLMEKGLKKRN